MGTILVVDDDVDILDTLRDVLSRAGHQVVTAENGQEALSRLAAMPRPCLILLDLMMPVMNGLELLAAGLKSGVIVGIPVVVMTAYHELASRAKGSAAVLEKPFDLDVLLSWVQRFCGC